MDRLKLAALAAFSIAGLSLAVAQTTPPPKSSPPAATETPPIPGANSFTEAQAKGRMEKAGFSQVTNLKKERVIPRVVNRHRPIEIDNFRHVSSSTPMPEVFDGQMIRQPFTQAFPRVHSVPFLRLTTGTGSLHRRP